MKYEYVDTYRFSGSCSQNILTEGGREEAKLNVNEQMRNRIK